MAAVPGAGLLALLRKRSEGGEAAAGPASNPVFATAAGAAAAPSKFEARSSAVHALEHAVAAGTVHEAARPVAHGRRIPPGPSYIYDVDVHAPHEAQPQLSVTPVTLINTDFALHHYRQNAVSADYICYGLKQGHIRVLSRHSAVRALLKGHTKPLTDLQFAAGSGGGGSNGSGGSGLLASGGQDGQLFVWHLWLDEDAGTIRETQKLHAHFVTAAGSGGGDVFLSWHGPSRRMLAVGVGGKVLLVAVPLEGMEQLEFELEDDSTPDASVLPDWTGEPVSCLSFSPDGQLLAVGGSEGTVRVWELRSSAAVTAGGSPTLAASGSSSLPAATAGGAVGAVRWLPTPEGGGWVLLTGNHNNSSLQLWYRGGAVGSEWTLLQSLAFEGKDGHQDFFIHVDLVPSQQLVVMADTVRNAVYTLHYSGAGASMRFDYLSRFGVAVPILSFTALWNPMGGEQHDMPVVELNCVQTTAIQQYTLDPLLCYDGGAEEEQQDMDDGVVRRSSLLERDGKDLKDLTICAQPSTAVPMPSPELASGTPTPRKDAAGAGASPQKPLAPSPPAPAPAEETPAPEAAEEAATDAAAAAAVRVPPEVEPSIEGAVSLAGIPPPPLPPGPEAEPLEPKGASGEVTPEECPSPPPTPTEQQRLQEAAAAEAAAAPSGVAPPPPRLLTPSDLLQSASSSTATTGRSSPVSASSSARRGPSPSAVQAQPQQRASRPPPHTEERATSPGPLLMPVPLPAAAAAEGPAAEAEAAAVPPSSTIAVAAPSAAAGGSGPATAAVDEAAVAAAVMEQMGGVHKKFVGHVSLMYRELLKAMKAEMSAQAAAQQQAMAQLLAAAIENQKQQIEAERVAVLSEERGNIQRLITAISTTLNHDLPAKMQEVVRGELAGVSESLAASIAASVAPSVQQALAASLPKELSGAVKAGLDKQLGPAVSAGLGKPLQEAFRSAFSKQVVPAFEAASQAMFQQINGAFSAGLEEHLQASKSALSEPAQLASQLAASLSSAQSLAASLSQGQQQLLRAQSMSGTGSHSPAAAPLDVRSELSALLRSGAYEKAFSTALGLQDVATVGWLAAQADAATVLSKEPCPLSQMVLLSLVQQLSADLTTDLSAKLAWIREAAMVVNPQDPLLARHVRPVLEGVYSALQAAAGRMTGGEASSCRLAMHVVHSQMTS